jgi:glutamate--cysteine ligase
MTEAAYGSERGADLHRPADTVERALQKTESPTVTSLDDLLAPFYEAEKPPPEWRVGTESEKFGVYVEDGRAIPFEGDRGVRAVLLALCERHGWFIEREHEGGEVIALKRGGGSITLEPGGQLELSGAPLSTIHQTHEELAEHLAELRDVSAPLGIEWLGLGFHPLARQEDLPWVPKLRYGVMKQYLPTRGSMALDMMRRTATVQANYDFSSESDASRKVRAGLALSPIVTAMFANSPFVEGRATGERTHRGRVWLDVDPDRSGLLPFAWSEDFGYRDYVEWALDIPMFLIKRDGQLVRNTGQTFRAFMRDGFEGHIANADDWLMHINTIFPEVRLKKTIEVRGADGQPASTLSALPALFLGIYHDEEALRRVESLVSSLDHDLAQAARPAVADLGLEATLAGRSLADWAGDVIEIAESGLERLSHLNAEGQDERIYLAPLRALVEKRWTPADALLDAIDPGADLVPQLLVKALA